MAEMTVELVAVERQLWSGDASFIVARTTEGEIGVLPGHVSTLAELEKAAVVRIDSTDGKSLTVAVHGGFLSITPDTVTILAEMAELSDEIDVERARSAQDRADTSTDEGAAAAARAETRLKAADASG
ncbi:MAG TPA: F0F1 ATP synthase subunit epsilon [Pseudonocardia sp.]|jgi:F-type H+-transporting ATPase subunit epsilon|uniref:F0F1 ATP synthase subunit epsilon n=1 Tax=Pseudonocardia sp. TaxID=60912 RepID=UPI002F3E8969